MQNVCYISQCKMTEKYRRARCYVWILYCFWIPPNIDLTLLSDIWYICFENFPKFLDSNYISWLDSRFKLFCWFWIFVREACTPSIYALLALEWWDYSTTTAPLRGLICPFMNQFINCFIYLQNFFYQYTERYFLEYRLSEALLLSLFPGKVIQREQINLIKNDKKSWSDGNDELFLKRKIPRNDLRRSTFGCAVAAWRVLAELWSRCSFIRPAKK